MLAASTSCGGELLLIACIAKVCACRQGEMQLPELLLFWPRRYAQGWLAGISICRCRQAGFVIANFAH